jgi:hypothetical protein
MHCPACGKLLARRTKFCTHCGEQLRAEDDKAITKLEKRFDDYVDGLFWTTVFGLGLIIGGMVVMKKVLQLDQGLILAYFALSSLTFLTIFVICLREVIVLARQKYNAGDEGEQFDTKELTEAKAPPSLSEAVSVTENTTRALEIRPKEDVPR